ncbi:nicotinate phosphoribosyltransferase [Candidatus Bathyarchaeota archaeon]|nr:nicotinate phosphoribosyltransferase [Candidatus Bathyarchaeota archaeon]
MGRFHIASEEEIRSGGTTDIYFVRTREILKAKGLENIRVTMEATAGELPNGWSWAVLCGVDEVIHLFEGQPVNLYSMDEGTVFRPRDVYGVRVPVMSLSGKYGDFCHLETPMLGLICQASGVATKAARVRKAAVDKVVISFGIRRIHPALSRMVDRAAYIGGLDGVSSLSGADTIGKKPMGTMPHALIIAFGDQTEAWKAYDEVMPEDVPRIALVDTYYDEKTEAIMAAETLKDRLQGVRLDTPTSRKGRFTDIVREVRWELDTRGYRNVKIYVSGGLDERNILELVDAGAEGFGVGTSISNAPTIDFALDIVEREGRPDAKRGKFSGCKQVWRCPTCVVDLVTRVDIENPDCPRCGGSTIPMLKPIVEDGKVLRELPTVDEIRKRVIEQLRFFEL